MATHTESFYEDAVMCSLRIAPRQTCAELRSQSLGEGGGSGGLEEGLEVNTTEPASVL